MLGSTGSNSCVAKRARRNPVNRTYANSPLLACGSTRQYAAARGRMRNFRRARSRPEQRINPSGSRHPTDSPRRCRSDPAVRDTCRPAFVGTSWGACRAPDPSGWPLVPPRPLGDHTDETFGPFCRDRPRVTRRSESETGVRVRERMFPISAVDCQTVRRRPRPTGCPDPAPRTAAN